MDANQIIEVLECNLGDVPTEDRRRVLAAAVGFAFGRIEGWPAGADQESALAAVLASACERVADGPQTYAEARTDSDWMAEFIEQGRRAIEGSAE
jgi:hypothetical protein